MTKLFFTADYHLNHSNIIKYCNRPFKDVYHMNSTIVKNHNGIVTDDDIVYHLGDFCFKSHPAMYWESQLNGDIVHFKGNHDKNNGTKSYIKSAIMEFGGLKIYATHVPPDTTTKKWTLEGAIIDSCDIILCGHVHEKWKYIMIRNKICLNMGVDVWNFEPVSVPSILKCVSNIRKGRFI